MAHNKIAVITTVYNEDVFLPIWLRHYGGLLGYQNLYVIDDGSTDGSTSNIGPVNVVHRPKAAIDQYIRAATVSELLNELLAHYEIVIFTDVDELLVLDPLLKRDLGDHLLQVPAKHMNAFGLNVLHDPLSEPAYDPNHPILKQRRWLQYERGYCKQLVHKDPAYFFPGFHRTTSPTNMIPGLYLFHLRACDYNTSHKRITRRNNLDWSDRSLSANHGVQNRLSADVYLEAYHGITLQRTLSDARPAAEFNAFVVEKLHSLKLPNTDDPRHVVKRGDAVGRPDRFAESIAAANAPLNATEQARQETYGPISADEFEGLYEAALTTGKERADTMVR